MSLLELHGDVLARRFCRSADGYYVPLLTVFAITTLLLVYRQLTLPAGPAEVSFLVRWLYRDPIALGLLGVSLLLLVWQVSFAVRYRPFARVPAWQLPSLTVVVPAYNEGAQILDTVRSVMASDYPKSLLQVICIDDGSADDTWHWMTLAQEEFPTSLTLIKQPRNLGKRAALMAGFAQARGTVIVTLDSDSEVLPDTFAHIVSPFALDPRVGSAAGNVRVLNLNGGRIPKMLEVSFTSAFDFIRAGQSVYGGVFCTPGALSAYRASVLKPLLEEWSGQTFMGKPATIGEDRALTNLVLASGHRVVYQRDAVVLTKVPVNFGSLKRMLTRWARSNVRENLVMLTYVFGRFRDGGAGTRWVRLFTVSQMIRLTVFESLKIVLLVALLTDAPSALVSIAIGCALASIIPSTVYYLRHRSGFGLRWALPYSYFWLICLSWIQLWGMFTASNSGWLTRTAPLVPSIRQPTLATTPSGAGREDLPVAA